jgi:hypothetical protein
VNYLFIGIACIALIFFLISLKRLNTFQSELIERFGSTKLKRLGNMLFIVPILVILVVIPFYLFLWRSEAWLRFAHMIWVLGLWMLGTISFFTFTIPARIKIVYPFSALAAAISSIAMAVYFTPLPRFASIFTNTPNLLLSVICGGMNLCWSWVVTYRIRATA